MISIAARRPVSVSTAPRYGSWLTSPRPASFFSIPVTDGGETPMRSAIADVVARPLVRLELVDDAEVVLDRLAEKRFSHSI